jgi:predicted outer membrane repeat protein
MMTNYKKLFSLIASIVIATNITLGAFAASVVDINTGNEVKFDTGELQEAIDYAQSQRIEDGEIHTVTLTTDEVLDESLKITDSVILDLNDNTLTVDENVNDNVIDIELDNVSAVIIENGTISGGNDYYGGGIQITDNNTSEDFTEIIIDNVTITNNSADFGGGIYATGLLNNGNGNITIIDSEISGNTAIENGGGINIIDFENVTIKDTIISDNTVEGFGVGGGISVDGVSNLVIEDSKINNNTVDGQFGYGGGIYTTDTNITITGSEISENEASWGGGILGFVSNITLDDSAAISNNTATNSGDDIYIIANEYFESTITLNVPSGTLNSDNQNIDGWYEDGVDAYNPLRWGEYIEELDSNYYSKEENTELVLNNDLALKAAHGEIIEEIVDPSDEDDSEPELPKKEENSFDNDVNYKAPVATIDVSFDVEKQDKENIKVVETPEEPIEEIVEVIEDTNEIEIIEEEVPKTELPVEIDGSVPRTGDNTFVWVCLIVLSISGLFLFRTKKNEE